MLTCKMSAPTAHTRHHVLPGKTHIAGQALVLIYLTVTG
jgi:hypothetical protein